MNTTANITIGQIHSVNVRGVTLPAKIMSIKGRWVKVQYEDGIEANLGFANIGEQITKVEISKDSEKPMPKNGVIDPLRRANYIKTVIDKVVHVDCGDELATILRGKELDEVYVIAAKKLETTVSALKDKYGHLNPGMQRMNLANRIRKGFSGE